MQAELPLSTHAHGAYAQCTPSAFTHVFGKHLLGFRLSFSSYDHKKAIGSSVSQPAESMIGSTCFRAMGRMCDTLCIACFTSICSIFWR